MQYAGYLSRRALRRTASPIRLLQPLLSLPGIISLGGGYPNANTFPFKDISYTLKDNSNGDNSTDTPVTFSFAENNVLLPALQYSSSYGIDALLNQLKKLQEREHGKGIEEGEAARLICTTTGSQDALSKAFDMILNEEDTIITEDPTYSGALAALRPIGCNIVGVSTDKEGLIPDSLAELLSNFNSTHPTFNKPKVLYTIPTGQNPGGSTTTLQRRKAILDICKSNDLLLFEDDPYYYVYYGEGDNIPSYLSLDTEGRVIRFDSVSKIISSGIRFGFATGPAALIEKMQLDQQASCMNICAVTQVMMASLLERWGEEGWKKQVKEVSGYYRQRRDSFLRFAHLHLAGLAHFHPPDAGMFLWLRLEGVEDSTNLITEEARREKVLLVPGAAFSPNAVNTTNANSKNGTPFNGSPFVRASFSTATDEEMDEALARFARVLRAHASKSTT